MFISGTLIPCTHFKVSYLVKLQTISEKLKMDFKKVHVKIMVKIKHIFDYELVVCLIHKVGT